MPSLFALPKSECSQELFPRENVRAQHNKVTAFVHQRAIAKKKNHSKLSLKIVNSESVCLWQVLCSTLKRNEGSKCACLLKTCRRSWIAQQKLFLRVFAIASPNMIHIKYRNNHFKSVALRLFVL